MATLSSRLSPLTVSVPAGSEWTSYQPTVTNATGSAFNLLWRRNLDTLEIKMGSGDASSLTPTGAANAPVTFTIPSGLTIDSTKSNTSPASQPGYQSIVGEGVLYDGAGSFDALASAVKCIFAIGSSTTITIGYMANGSANAHGFLQWRAAQDPFGSAGAARRFYISDTLVIPISGWTSHVATTTGPNALVVGGQSVGSTLSFGATSNQGFNILANNAAAIASTAAGALTLGLPSKIGSSDYAGQAIVGRTDGLAPAAGYVGQTVEGTQTALTSFPATGTYGDGTSVTLTSGRWMLSMVLDADQNGATGTLVTAGIGTASGTGSAGLTPGDTQLSITFPTASTNTGISVPAALKNITASTTYYLKVRADYTVGTPRYRCRLTAVRIA
jgi:hypothetical protein